MGLEGKVAVISGGSQGIGYAIAERFAIDGAIVVIGNRNEEKGREAAARLGGRASFIQLDVSSEDSWQSLFDQVMATYGHVDVLVNSAGITGGAADVEHETKEDWDKVFGCNAFGVFAGTRLAMAHMTQGGSIVNIISMAGVFAEPVAAAYIASKGAARMLSKHAALYGATKENKVRVNAVFPGSTNTPMVEEITRLQPEVMAAQMAKIPMGKFAEPEDIANVCAFLASDEASYITGAEIMVDGGISCGF